MNGLRWTIVFGVIATASPPPAHADDTSCKATVAEKKLSGAARTSFMKKCETDAKSRCDMTAGDKKLAGAARTSFTKKCLSDAVGA